MSLSSPPLQRRGGPTIGGSQTTFIIVIAVAGTVAVFIGLMIWRAIRHSRARRESAPLPPPQALAHHRELQLSRFEEAKFVASHQPSMLYPSDSALASSSSASLIPAAASYGVNSATATAESVADELAPPTPKFHGSRPQSASSDSSFSQGHSAQGHSPADSPLPSPSATSNSHSQSTHDIRKAHRASRMSYTSASPSRLSARSLSSGAPHARHSQVQIVLPAPLAPSLYDHMVIGAEDAWGRRIGTPEAGTVPAAAAPLSDPWTGVVAGIRPTSSISSAPEQPALSSKRSSKRLSSRTQSMSPLSRTPSPVTPAQPPVPRLPSEFSSYNSSRVNIPPSSYSTPAGSRPPGSGPSRSQSTGPPSGPPSRNSSRVDLAGRAA